ncbi:glycosyltransferase [Pelagibacteraceae bacterium]|jgi:N-acetylglucosaminyl-diphospho-decaprenol L-rhamnosyltransferase|nr:glycosyltransferase [Pelagibacteraceae bacterium]
MNKHVTLVFSAYQSHKLLSKIIKKLDKNYKILVIENSLDIQLKTSLENKFKNVEVIIPDQNLGLAKSYNLGIKKSKTKYVFLNNPDHEIKNETIKKLLLCAEKIKKFGILSPTYINEKVYKNYEVYTPKIDENSSIFKKYAIKEVDIIDNCFFVNRNIVKKNLFDENFFLYFETFDFCKQLNKKGIKLFVCNKIKYAHSGASSVDNKFVKIVKLTRAFHYNWSKFYFFKKNYSYLYALRKILPNIAKSFKKILISIIKLDKNNLIVGLIELYGATTSALLLKPFYRPKM